jgi:hypothetical protein
MGLEELRKKREKRWDQLLEHAYSECDRKYSTCKTTETQDRHLIAELNEIRFSDDSYLNNYLNCDVESTLTFTEYYKSFQISIPVLWYEIDSSSSSSSSSPSSSASSSSPSSSPSSSSPSSSSSDEWFLKYNSLEILSSLNEITRQMIWIDVPRTFNIFVKRSSHCSTILSNPLRRAYYLTVLCRILSMTSCLLGGWYCQGMSFVAASYIFYYDDISAILWSSSSTPLISNTSLIDFQHNLFLLHELYSCCTYYHLILQSNNLSALYEWNVFLTLYLEEFEYQLSHTPDTQQLYRHLQGLKYPIEFFSMEWFTTCYVLSTSYEVSVHIQDMMIHGNESGVRVDLLIRIGMAILITLRSQIMQFEGQSSLFFLSLSLYLSQLFRPSPLSPPLGSDLESMQTDFRELVLQLTPEQIIPTAVRYQILRRADEQNERLSESGDSNTISDNILSVSHTLFPLFVFKYFYPSEDSALVTVSHKVQLNSRRVQSELNGTEVA